MSEYNLLMAEEMERQYREDLEGELWEGLYEDLFDAFLPEDNFFPNSMSEDTEGV
jgi:hypothetical protein